METRPVFFDPGGRRRAFFPRVLAFLIAVAAVVSVAFFMTLLAVPSLRGLDPLKPHVFNPKAQVQPKVPGAAFRKSRKELFAEIARARKPDPPTVSKSSAVVAAFYDPSQETGVNSLRAFGGNLTHVIPAWLHIANGGDELDTGDFDYSANPHNEDVIRAARKAGVRIMPLLSNSSDGVFDPAIVRPLLDSVAKSKSMAAELREWLVSNDFQGLNIDFEDLTDEDEKLVPRFLSTLQEAFKPASLELTIDIESSTLSDPDMVKELVGPCDWAVVMAYDQHWESSPPGPIAAIDWSENVLDQALTAIPADKLVIGIGNYSYDWGPSGNAEPLTFQEALATAAGYRDGEKPEDVVDFDSQALNSTFDYDDDAGKPHTVWMLDAASAFDEWKGALNHNVRGAGVWALGEEDPGIWTFLNRSEPEGEPDARQMDSVKFPYGVDQMGQGEILNVLRRPTDGSRSFTTDKDSGLITDMEYHTYPFPYVLRHSGYIPKALALTFDDGPDQRYTPEVLDELKRLGIPATFFVVGRCVESFPGLVRREYDEGHEIGSHTFTHPDLSAVSPRRQQLEMNATLRAIQSVTGHSTVLFRPPFNADSEPESPQEMEPVDMADNLGYTTIGEKVDPQDWNLEMVQPDGSIRQKTSDDIARLVLDGVHENARKHQEGNIILLHDAGGPRSATVASLRKFVPQLQREGYHFVPVSALMKRTRDEIMPPVSAKDRLAIWFDGLVFSSVFAGESLLATSFLTAIGLGILRFMFVTPLAFVHRRQLALQQFDPEYKPSVCALIAAFNEEKVICRTIASVLASHYPIDQVVVVDDGSTDTTFDTVAAAFGGDARVVLVHQANGGKASALNHGFSLCRSEIAVCIDADTQLNVNAVAMLARHFQDPKVAAVAGNVQVGNPVNVLTKWQALEYTTSQNMDRRAYAALNSITVVPGAIGAWRRSAVIEVGGYQTDTLAEDMDLTWRLRRSELRAESEPFAYAYTEAPDSFRGFFRQRFRWAYGTLQCLFKHRGALFHYGWFGWLALPTMWLFQIVFQALAPLVDVQVVYSLTGWVSAFQMTHAAAKSGASQESAQMALDGASASLAQVLILYAIFFAVELISGFLAYRLERQKATPLVWLFLQRFAYRQVMYGVIYKSIGRALAGGREGWGKIERKGTVVAG